MKGKMMILEDIANLFCELAKKNNHKEIARHFGRERKFVINAKCGCSFVLNSKFIAGLNHYGYVLKLEKKEKNLESKKIDKQKDVLLELLVSTESDRICDEMSTTEYCEKNCNYACPQKKCYLKYAELKAKDEI